MTTTTAYEIPFTVSRHALERALDMGLDGEHIREAIVNPRNVRRLPEDREARTRGKVTVIITTTVPAVVVTVMWGTAAAWAADNETNQSRGVQKRDSMTRFRGAQKMQKKYGKHGHRR